MNQETTIGARLRTLRRWRGMKLVEVAGLAGISKTHLSDIERGLKALDRRSYIAGLARALNVSEADIVGGPHLSHDPQQSAPHGYIPQLRDALESNSVYRDPVVDRARPLPELVRLMTGPIESSRRRYDYVQVGRELPGLIDELHLHVRQGDEAEQITALETLIEAYMCAAGMARSLAYPDLGHIAAMRADEVAVTLGDPVARGKVAFSLIRPSASNWSRVKVLAERAVDELDPHVRSGQDVQVLGMLMLNASLACAATLNGGAAEAWLTRAEELAARVPDDMAGNWQAFCATNVRVWRVAIGVEYGESGALVASKAAAVEDAKLAVHPGRRAAFYADVGRGLARERRTQNEAVAWLKKAESIAPQRVRNDSKVSETVAVMVEQARANAVGREIRGLAARLGIPH